MDNSKNVIAWSSKKFLGQYPFDFDLYLRDIKEIKSYKTVANSVRAHCNRQIDFLESQAGKSHIRVLQSKRRTNTNTKIIQENLLELSQIQEIALQDSNLAPGQEGSLGVFNLHGGSVLLHYKSISIDLNLPSHQLAQVPFLALVKCRLLAPALPLLLPRPYFLVVANFAISPRTR